MENLNTFDGRKRYPESNPDRWKQNYERIKSEGYVLLFAKQLILQSQSYRVPVVNKGGKIEFMDADTCDLVIATGYDGMKGWFYDKHSLVAVKEDKKWGVIDARGKVVIPFNYTLIIPPINSSLFAAQKWDNNGHGAWGVIDVEQNVVVPFSSDYSIIEGYDNGVCRVHSKDGTWAVFNEGGKEVVKFGEYDNILPIYDSGYPVVRMEKTIEEGKKIVKEINKRALAGRVIV